MREFLAGVLVGAGLTVIVAAITLMILTDTWQFWADWPVDVPAELRER